MIHPLSLALLVATLPCAAYGAAYRLPIKLSSAVKAQKARGLGAEARAALQRDGSVVVAGEQHHFFSLYEQNAYEGIPSFVTIDVLLHVFHVRFDLALREFEARTLAPQLKALAGAQAARALGFFPKEKPVERRLKWLAVYHAIPFALLTGDRWRTLLPGRVDPAFVEQIGAEVDHFAAAARAASKFGKSEPCPGNIDFTLFKPRGHYDRDELRDYFRAMSFYNLCFFDLSNRKDVALAVDLARLADAPARESLTRIGKATRTIFGLPDDNGLPELLLLTAGLPALPAPLSEKALGEVAARAGTLPKNRVPDQHEVDEPPKPIFRLLGAAATPDTLLFASTTDPEKRGLPSALDLMATLGSTQARELLKTELPKVEGFEQAISKPLETANRGFYGRWLEVLRLVLTTPTRDHPAFELTPAWNRRLLVSASGCWAELRHDTLLYVKQLRRMVFAEGGHEEELPPVQAGGYVEPRPEVYRALGGLTREIEALFGADAGLAGLQDLLSFATRVAELELSGKRVPREIDDRLREIGAEIEQVSRTGEDRIEDDALVADVAAAVYVDPEGGTGSREGDGGGEIRIREVATGDIDEIWVVVPRGNRLLVTRGAVFSYYEFDSPTRLTDDEWRKTLRETRPARPDWARRIESRPTRSRMRK